MTNEEFFALAERTIWRLETLAQYNPRSSDAYQHWRLTGELLPLEQRPAKQAWMAAVRAAVDAGKQVGRVRVHRGGDARSYGAYELAVYPENQAAGEDVRIADLRVHPELAFYATRDFWLMDENLALLMDYDEDGQFLGMARTRDPEVLARCRQVRDLAVACSVPLEEYLALEPQRG